MLSEENYRELVRYRNGPILVGDDGLSKRELHLKEQRYIEAAARERKIDSVDDIEIVTLSYKITPLGEDALSEFEKVRDEKAKDERQKSLSNKLAILGIAVSLITFILGILIGHYSDIVETITTLIQR